MKRLLVICILVFICSFSNAQDQQNEVYLSYSLGTFQGINDGIQQVIDGLFEGSNVDNESKSVGVINFGYNRALSDLVWLGITASYVKYNNTSEVTPYNNDPPYTAKWDDQFITTMIRLDFHYVRKEIITLYSGLAIGASFESITNVSNTDVTDDSNTLFAGQLNAFGMRFGKQIGGFIEFGLGYVGFVSFGLSGRF